MSKDADHGRFVWYDLMTSDTDAGVDFYSKLIGWSTTPWEGSDMPYTMWTNKEKPFGGVMPIPDDAKAQGAPPNWLAYICVSDVSAIADKAKGLGAKILHEPTDIPDAGCFAVLQDPQGAVFAVYASSSELDAEAPAQIGEFSWHELATDDHGAAFDFYSELFGWDKSEAMDMGPEAGIYQLYARNGNQLGGMFNRPKEMPVSAWLYYVTVDDVHTSVEKVRDLGGTVINGPMEVPGGEFIAQCIDPQGAMFALHSAAK